MGQKLRQKKVQDKFLSGNHSVPEGKFYNKRYVFQENSYPEIRKTFFGPKMGGWLIHGINLYLGKYGTCVQAFMQQKKHCHWLILGHVVLVRFKHYYPEGHVIVTGAGTYSMWPEHSNNNNTSYWQLATRGFSVATYNSRGNQIDIAQIAIYNNYCFLQIKSNQMLVFGERGKREYPGKNLS